MTRSILNRRLFLLTTAGVALAGGTAAFGWRVLATPPLLDASVEDYLRRSPGRPPAASAQALHTFVISLKALGLWDKLDALWDLQAQTREQALLNIKGDHFDLMIEGDMRHTPGFGLTGDGRTGFGRTGIFPSKKQTLFSQDSATLGVFCAHNTNGGGNFAFGCESGNLRLKTRQVPGEAPSGYLNDSGKPLTGEEMSGWMPGLSLVTRTGARDLSVYKNDRLVGQINQSSVSVTPQEIWLGRMNNHFTSETYSLAFAGAGLTKQEVALLSVAIRDYLAVMMRPIACFGDSLTQGVRAMGKKPMATVTNYPNGLQALTERVVYNGGLSGQTSTEIRQRAETDNMMNAALNVIWAGRNNFMDPDDVLLDIDKIVKHLTHDRYVVMSVLNGDYPEEGKGKVRYKVILDLNEQLAQHYGDRFLDIRKILIAAAKPGNEADARDVERDIVPGSLRSDTIHMNDDGDAIVAHAVSNFIADKGW